MRWPMLLVVTAGLAACTETLTTPAVPETGPVAGSEIGALVEGGPYDVRVFVGQDAGTAGSGVMWDFSAGTVSGNFETAAGETGTFSIPAEIVGNQLCAGEGDGRECHFVYRIENGFMEVNADGSVHAVSRRTS